MDKVTIEDFAKLEFKVGTVLEAEEIEGSEKLLKLKVDLGEEEPRQILSGIKKWYSPEDLKGKQFVFITNLAPRQMMGLESNGMIMAAEGEDKPIPLTVSSPVLNGAKIR